MKHRFLAITLVLLLCAGCAANPVAPVETSPGVTTTQPTVTEPPGCYVPDHPLESASKGALRVYGLTQELPDGILPMGQNVLLFSGESVTTLTLLAGSSLYPKATVTLECAVSPGSPAVQVSEKGMTYFNENTAELVFLDSALKEVRRLSLPEPVTSTPTLSQNWNLIYYSTAEALKVLDLETGFVRLLRETGTKELHPTALHCDETILQCEGMDELGFWHTYYLSTQTGESHYDTAVSIDLHTQSDRYFAVLDDSSYRELLTGTVSESPMSLEYSDFDCEILPVPELELVILGTNQPDTESTVLSVYDLQTGSCVSTLELPGSHIFRCARGVSGTDCIYLLAYDTSTEADLLLCWNTGKSPSTDTQQYLIPRYTANSPDTAGLAQCQALADSLSQKYAVDIRIWEDAVAVQPSDYSLHPEYRVPLIMRGLETLDEALSNYPEGMLSETVANTADGVLHIALVRSITGQPAAGGLDNSGGLQFWDDNNASYVALSLNEQLLGTLYHELCHVLENHVLISCTVYDDWNNNKLNPEGFVYDYDYILNLNRTDGGYLEQETRAFIDTYSMSFPKEDRARIMEYAMQPGNESFFSSPIMQNKLQHLAWGIRKTFDLRKVETVYLWEQYLNEPIWVKHP